MKTVTCTCDYGKINDLGRRNISKMCAKALALKMFLLLNIFTKSCYTIAMNIKVWLRSNHLDK